MQLMEFAAADAADAADVFEESNRYRYIVIPNTLPRDRTRTLDRLTRLDDEEVSLRSDGGVTGDRGDGRGVDGGSGWGAWRTW